MARSAANLSIVLPVGAAGVGLVSVTLASGRTAIALDVVCIALAFVAVARFMRQIPEADMWSDLRRQRRRRRWRRWWR